MGKSTIFRENIINETYCTIIKIPLSMKDKFRIVWMKIQFSNLILIVKPKSLIPSPQKSQTKVPIPRKPKSPKLQGFRDWG